MPATIDGGGYNTVVWGDRSTGSLTTMGHLIWKGAQDKPVNIAYTHRNIDLCVSKIWELWCGWWFAKHVFYNNTWQKCSFHSIPISLRGIHLSICMHIISQHQPEMAVIENDVQLWAYQQQDRRIVNVFHRHLHYFHSKSHLFAITTSPLSHRLGSI